METQITTLILRWLVVVAMLAVAYEAWAITTLLENQRLIRIVKKIANGLIVFAIARLFASIADNYVGFGIGVCSNVINYAFWIWVFWYFHRQKKRLQSESIGPDGRRRLSNSIDEILDELRYEREKLITGG
jgi:hypothetical protein